MSGCSCRKPFILPADQQRCPPLAAERYVQISAVWCECGRLGEGGLTGGGQKHPLCFKLHVRTVELIQFLAAALLEVCQTRQRYVHSAQTDWKHTSDVFDEPALTAAIKCLHIICCKFMPSRFVSHVFPFYIPQNNNQYLTVHLHLNETN